MPMRHAQRQHIISSIERLLYQLYTISFFLSPFLLPFLCRTIFQFQFARPRDIDPRLSLRFWFILILLFNLSSIWAHAFQGPTMGRSVILDFVGTARPPTKLQLLSIDFAIVVLNMVLTTIAYETSVQAAMPADTPDPLLPLPPSMPATPILFDEDAPKTDLQIEPQYIIDLHLRHIIHRLRNPAPPPAERDASAEDLLPLPNTTPFQLSNSLRLLMQIRARVRTRAQNETETRRGQGGEAGDNRTIPGGLDST
ncbi:hypothetical protein PHLGIDRAFT_31161 [Phlebiopsis gigantea 11061_1 CR5-6]|uniref:DUF1746 domain-containing protein n=1 Tax=Phlebiopsis gigantea (strain 11061_1 CR5-6) TaxID=745531 RepID=A0A0C3RUU6_PHLG1|nr:hypothetical protein PHLGIDRAFT_31161 [Phlebiopsis gigantea 11061_1 CR5-6]